MPTNIGRVLYGYCDGYFGRDSYCAKRIEGEGVDWVVVRDVGKVVAYPTFAAFGSEAEKSALLDEWASPPEDEDIS